VSLGRTGATEDELRCDSKAAHSSSSSSSSPVAAPAVGAWSPGAGAGTRAGLREQGWVGAGSEC